MLRQVFDKPNIMPGLSSQTTTTWPLVWREREEQIIGYSVGHVASSLIIQAPKEGTWNEVMEEVLAEYSQAWKALADL